MGFNWGAFSGGLAEGIEKGADLAMKNRQLQATIEQNNQKMLYEQQKLEQEGRLKQAEIDRKTRDDVNKTNSELVKNLSDAKVDPTIAFNNYNSANKINGINSGKFIINGQDGNQYVADLPLDTGESIVNEINANISTYNGNGLYKIDNTGKLLARQNGQDEFTPVQGINTSSLTQVRKVAESQDIKSYIVDGKQVQISKQEAGRLSDSGKEVKAADGTNIKIEAGVMGQEKISTDYQTAKQAFIASLGGRQPTPEEVQDFNKKYVDKTLGGTSVNSGNIKTSSVLENTSAVSDIIGDKTLYSQLTPVEKNKLSFIESSNLYNLPKVKQDQANADIKTLQANYNAITKIDNLLDNPNTAKIETGVIDNVKTELIKMLGKDSETAINNIDFNTRGGMILANLIKEKSGLVASERERAFFEDMVRGGKYADEKYVLQSLVSFRNSIADDNKLLAANNKSYIPESAFKYTNYKDRTTNPLVNKDISTTVDANKKYSNAFR